MVSEAATPVDRPQALAGLRVIELGGEAGVYVGKLCADMGADVIKLEPPAGEATRRSGPFVHDVPGPNRSLPFWYFNTGKRSVTLDVRSASGADLARRLARTADLFIETLRPGELERHGLAYADLARARPELIYLSLTPFGQEGPWAGYATSDLVSLALAGIMASCGYDDVDGAPPIRPDGGHSLLIAAHYAFTGALVALVARDATGLWGSTSTPPTTSPPPVRLRWRCRTG